MSLNNSKYVIVYPTLEGDVRVNNIVKDETIWLILKGRTELFDVGVPAVSKHLKNILQRVRCSRN